jgi:CPW-WPC domain-containing protein
VQDIDGAVVADSQIFEQKTLEATNRIMSDLVESAQSKAIRVVAEQLAEQSVESWKYAGGCVRDYTGCPVEWSVEAGGSCSPPGHEVLCADAVMVSMTEAQKESVAEKCKASWPCKACVVTFSGCPVGWQAEGEVCAAPAGEFGPCGGAVDFSGMSKDARAVWSAVCGVRWPCA